MIRRVLRKGIRPFDHGLALIVLLAGPVADRAGRLFPDTRRLIHQARVSRLRGQFGACGPELDIQFPVTITEPDRVFFGDRVSLAAYVHVWGGGTVFLGDRVMVGTHTSITSLTHDPDARIMRDSLVRKPVRIGNDVWIGSNCVIMPGVTVGDGAVVGAGSVVTRDVPAGAVMAGVPARFIRQRKTGP